MSTRTIWRVVRVALLAAAAAGLAFRMRDLGDGDWTRLRVSLVHQLWLVVPVFVVSLSLRTRPALEVISAVLGGAASAMWLAQAGGDALIDAMGTDSPVRMAVAVPALEETAKLVPLVLVALVWWRRRGSPGVVDFGLLGMASGAGFAVHEDALWDRISGSGVDGSLGWLVPSMFTDTDVVAGHMVWTGVVGLALGMVVTRGWRWLPLLGVAGVVVGFDHGSWNLLDLRDQRWLLAQGWLPVVLLLAGLVAAFALDGRALRRIPRSARATPAGVARGHVPGLGDAGRNRLTGLRALRVAALAAYDRREMAELDRRLATTAGAAS